MLRRLPLLGAQAPEMPFLGPARVLLGPGSIALADTDTGVRAERFGCELAIGFASLGVAVELMLLGYQHVPVLAAVLQAELASRGIGLVQRAILSDLPPELASPSPAFDAVRGGAGVRLFVGLPAFGACRAASSLLLATDRPLTSWPALLRGVRAELSLELAAARPGLALALASALIQHGFLPRG